MTDAKLKKGEVVWRTSDDVAVLKWKDKREVYTISNKHTQPKLVPVTNRRGDQKMKPDSVKDYNNYMSGIDRTDQMLSYHFALRKTIRWYKKVAVHMIEIYLVNSFYLFNQSQMQRENVSLWPTFGSKFLVRWLDLFLRIRA